MNLQRNVGIRGYCFVWVSIVVFGVGGFLFIPRFAHADLTYATAYPDIGTFSNKWGNWSFWMGWDGNFSETYVPEGESYGWFVYFAPEAVYVALQSSKSVYSGVDVNAGFKEFYGVINLSGSDRLSESFLADLRSVSFSTNSFSASAPGIGVGALAIGNLSFSLSAGITLSREKTSDVLKRGVQLDAGLSISYDLVANPLPFSVSLGTDCEPGDPPELCQFHGFYPIIIWNIAQEAETNPIDLTVSKLNESTPASPESAVDATKKMLLRAVKIIQANPNLRSFMESQAHDSFYDATITEAQQWLQSGDTSNLPENLELPDPAEANQTMKPIFAATQMAFELGYQRGCEGDPDCRTLWLDCAEEQYCRQGKECVVTITAEDIASRIPGKTAADFENAWFRIDNPVEQYLISQAETEEWLQIQEGQATYRFSQNTDTPVVLGLRMDPPDAPVENRVHLCHRVVYFSTKGDVTDDGVVNLSDAVLALQICGGRSPENAIDRGADVNEDNRIELSDVVYVLQRVAKIRE